MGQDLPREEAYIGAKQKWVFKSDTRGRRGWEFLRKEGVLLSLEALCRPFPTVGGFVFKCRDESKGYSSYAVFLALFAKRKHPYLITVSSHRAEECQQRHCSAKWKEHQIDTKRLLISETPTKGSFTTERKRIQMMFLSLLKLSL